MNQLNINKSLSIGNYDDHNFPKVDSFTKENIGGYLRYFDLKDKKVITTDSSGDQLLNAAFFGARDLILCNRNIDAYYYLYLKIASLLELNYKEFQWFLLKNDMNMHHNNRVFSKRLFKKVYQTLKLINPEALNFFETEFDMYGNIGTREKMLVDSGYHNKAIKNFNIYLRNENAYNRLRNAIIKTNINYVIKDIMNDDITGKYDVILLSNLSTKLPLTKFVELIEKLDNNNLNNDAIIMLCYLWNNNIYTGDYANVWKRIYNDSNAKKILRKYITDIYEISGYKNYLWEDNKREDKVLVYHKK